MEPKAGIAVLDDPAGEFQKNLRSLGESVKNQCELFDEAAAKLSKRLDKQREKLEDAVKFIKESPRNWTSVPDEIYNVQDQLTKISKYFGFGRAGSAATGQLLINHMIGLLSKDGAIDDVLFPADDQSEMRQLVDDLTASIQEKSDIQSKIETIQHELTLNNYVEKYSTAIESISGIDPAKAISGEEIQGGVDIQTFGAKMTELNQLSSKLHQITGVISQLERNIIVMIAGLRQNAMLAAQEATLKAIETASDDLQNTPDYQKIQGQLESRVAELQSMGQYSDNAMKVLTQTYADLEKAYKQERELVTQISTNITKSFGEAITEWPSLLPFQSEFEAQIAKYSESQGIEELKLPTEIDMSSESCPTAYTGTVTPKDYQKFLGFYLSPTSPYRGLLALWDVGAGKTIGGIITAKDHLDAATTPIAKDNLSPLVWIIVPKNTQVKAWDSDIQRFSPEFENVPDTNGWMRDVLFPILEQNDLVDADSQLNYGDPARPRALPPARVYKRKDKDAWIGIVKLDSISVYLISALQYGFLKSNGILDQSGNIKPGAVNNDIYSKSSKVIVDEIHNLWKLDSKLARWVRDSELAQRHTGKILGLSATPITNPEKPDLSQVVGLTNLLRFFPGDPNLEKFSLEKYFGKNATVESILEETSPGKWEINDMEKFHKFFQGLPSHVSLVMDTTQYPYYDAVWCDPNWSSDKPSTGDALGKICSLTVHGDIPEDLQKQFQAQDVSVLQADQKAIREQRKWRYAIPNIIRVRVSPQELAEAKKVDREWYSQCGTLDGATLKCAELAGISPSRVGKQYRSGGTLGARSKGRIAGQFATKLPGKHIMIQTLDLGTNQIPSFTVFWKPFFEGLCETGGVRYFAEAPKGTILYQKIPGHRPFFPSYQSSKSGKFLRSKKLYTDDDVTQDRLAMSTMDMNQKADEWYQSATEAQRFLFLGNINRADRLRGDTGTTTCPLPGDLHEEYDSAVVDYWIALFNHPKNADGKYFQLALLSPQFAEGTNFFDIRYQHILNPPQDMLIKEQAEGRAFRSCAWRNLVKDVAKFPKITVFTYIATAADGIKTPEQILENWIYRDRRSQADAILDFWKEYAVDNGLFGEYSAQPVREGSVTIDFKKLNQNQAINAIVREAHNVASTSTDDKRILVNYAKQFYDPIQTDPSSGVLSDDQKLVNLAKNLVERSIGSVGDDLFARLVFILKGVQAAPGQIPSIAVGGEAIGTNYNQLARLLKDQSLAYAKQMQRKLELAEFARNPGNFIPGPFAYDTYGDKSQSEEEWLKSQVDEKLQDPDYENPDASKLTNKLQELKNVQMAPFYQVDE